MAIADYLPLAARQAAVAATYRPRYILRTTEGYCPLGVALRQMGFDVDAPPSCLVARRLAAAIDSEEYYAILRASGDFVNAWESGRIAPSDLAAALGVDGAAGQA